MCSLKKAFQTFLLVCGDIVGRIGPFTPNHIDIYNEHSPLLIRHTKDTQILQSLFISSSVAGLILNPLAILFSSVFLTAKASEHTTIVTNLWEYKWILGSIGTFTFLAWSLETIGFRMTSTAYGSLSSFLRLPISLAVNSLFTVVFDQKKSFVECHFFKKETFHNVHFFPTVGFKDNSVMKTSEFFFLSKRMKQYSLKRREGSEKAKQKTTAVSTMLRDLKHLQSSFGRHEEWENFLNFTKKKRIKRNSNSKKITTQEKQKK
ncbi:hypothetical protein RFI_10677 [Reticulomyxa filosa]|uniref:Uncharacterized protein n=1 Tax=Reticulomyxa filosa TaxID=46433 RepID=X6NM61_RETFI|nr:hypothetical protein RFI_10677 [Reticulomyxa filosa]|eukprot:ETO26462.1 hypothetical protein RFI_10677 [Reticulomyxa filosa]